MSVLEKKAKLAIGFITYGESTAKYLPYFLESLKKQTQRNWELFVVDNSESKENENIKLLKKFFPGLKINRPGENLGFARGYNLLINAARKQGAEYFLALNPDMVLEKDFVEKIISASGEENVGAIAPKILCWDFQNNKLTDMIDSTGISITREQRFSDLNQGEKDDGRFNESKFVFGFTGAAVLFRMEALIDVAFKNQAGHDEYFDELMFMYKEDCDLSYRLRLAGWKIVFAPEARAYHHRSAVPKGESNLKIALNRRNKSRQLKKWSFLNSLVIFFKFKNLNYSLNVKAAVCWYQFKSLIFICLFEQYLLLEFGKIWQMRREIRQKRDALKIRISLEKIEKLM